MKVIYIFGSSDKFEHSGYTLHTTTNSQRHDESYFSSLINQTKDYLAMGEYSKVRVIVHNIDEETGEVSVVENFSGENPKKKRLIINEEAVIKAAKRREGVKTSTTMFHPPTATQVFLDSLNTPNVGS